MTPRFYECACCGEFHKPLKPSAYLANNLYAGDCRNDVNRFSGDHPEVQEAERLGLIAWEGEEPCFCENCGASTEAVFFSPRGDGEYCRECFEKIEGSTP